MSYNLLRRLLHLDILNYQTLNMLIIALSILFVLFVAGVALTIKDAHTVETEDVYINETDAGKFTKNHHIQEIL